MLQRALAQTRAQSGYTLTELVVVVIILAIVAAVAIPNAPATDDSKLDVAASAVAAALRFAQAEAIRTGEAHGVYASTTEQSLRIYRRPATTPVYDVYDPLTKQRYEFDFSIGYTSVKISAVDFEFATLSGSQSYLDFSGGAGTPRYVSSGTVYMLDTGQIVLGYRDTLRSIAIEPMVGRVSIQ